VHKCCIVGRLNYSPCNYHSVTEATIQQAGTMQ